MNAKPPKTIMVFSGIALGMFVLAYGICTVCAEKIRQEKRRRAVQGY